MDWSAICTEIRDFRSLCPARARKQTGEHSITMIHTLKRYDMFEHTADVGILAYGKTLKQLFVNGGYALFDFMVDISSVEKVISRQVQLDCYDREELFVRWLSELLYLYDAESLVLKYFDVAFVRDGKLRAVVAGEKYSAARHQVLNQVKAVTYHQLRIVHEKDLWTARVILDL